MGKFRTKKFEVQEVVSRGVEAVYVHDGNQEKVLVCDEGDNGASSRSLSIRADLPVSVALQYAENVPVDNRFIALYQIESDNMKNADLELGFKLDKNGMIKLEKEQASQQIKEYFDQTENGLYEEGEDAPQQT